MAERADPRIPGFREGSKYRRKLFERYAFCNDYVENKITLDIPCGVGWGTSLLKGASDLHGVDIDKKSIDYANKTYDNINFLTGNLIKIPYVNEFFDIVVCLEGYEHITKRDQIIFIKEANRVMKEGGLIIITTPILTDKGLSTGNPFHLHEPSKKEAQDIFDKSFNTVKMDIIKGPDSEEIRFVGKKKYE